MRTYHNKPVPLTRADYEETAALATEALLKERSVKAVYIFGDIWIPGVSDMDLFVVADGYAALASPWSLGEKAKIIFTHRYLSMNEEAALSLFALFPQETTTLKLLGGKEVAFDDLKQWLPANEYKDLLACVFFDILITKLLPLMGELRYGETIDVRGRIGALYSLRYSERLLNLLCGYEMPVSLRERIVALRNQWFERDEAQSIALLEELSAQCVGLIAEMVRKFAQYTEKMHPTSPTVRFYNQRYALESTDEWSKEEFLYLYRRKRFRLSFLGRRIEHDTLLVPRALLIYLSYYAGGQGAFSSRVRVAYRGKPQTPEGGVAAHLAALNTAFQDYERSGGTHKIPYTFGFGPRPESWARRLLTTLCTSIK